jgi:hypothetical protein
MITAARSCVRRLASDVQHLCCLQVANTAGVDMMANVNHCWKGSTHPVDLQHDTLYVRRPLPVLPNSCSALDLATQVINLFLLYAVLDHDRFMYDADGSSYMLGTKGHWEEDMSGGR